MLERRQSARVDSLFDDPEVDQDEARRLGSVSGCSCRPSSRGQPIGTSPCTTSSVASPRFSDDDLRLAETFAHRAAVAVDLSERVDGIRSGE